MRKKEFLARWKEDWEERKEDFSSGQAELLREIRDTKNIVLNMKRSRNKNMCVQTQQEI